MAWKRSTVRLRYAPPILFVWTIFSVEHIGLAAAPQNTSIADMVAPEQRSAINPEIMRCDSTRLGSVDMQYLSNPYLDALGDAELQDRSAFIADNIVRYNSNGQFRFVTNAEGAGFWQQKAEDVIQCLVSRGREDFLKRPNPNICILPIKHDIRQKKGYAQYKPWGRIPELPELTAWPLFKFGKFTHLEKTFAAGKIRISPASSYKDPRLNTAQHDAYELHLLLRPSKYYRPTISLVRETGEEIINTATHSYKAIGIEIGGDQDFFVWCCSKVFEPRFFIDFEADACLIIHDGTEFVRRLNQALCKRIERLPIMQGNDVRYYDPLRPDNVLHEILKPELSIFSLRTSVTHIKMNIGLFGLCWTIGRSPRKT